MVFRGGSGFQGLDKGSKKIIFEFRGIAFLKRVEESGE
jgi:hypothetical protein